MDAHRQDMLDRLQRSGDVFTRRVTGFTDREWSAAAGGWSVAQVAEHLALVEMSSGKFLAKRVFTEPAGAEVLAETAGKDQLLHRWMPVRERRREAPDFVQPKGTWASRDELLSAFWHWRGSTTALLSDPARDPRRYAGPHPAFGMLDALQWGLSLSLHLERHLAQMDDILAAAAPET